MGQGRRQINVDGGRELQCSPMDLGAGVMWYKVRWYILEGRPLYCMLIWIQCVIPGKGIDGVGRLAYEMDKQEKCMCFANGSVA